MSLQATADILAKGDPDRFRATMAAPVADRARLFPIYAFNVEVARAPWVASEPMIGEMRLQWWRDALDQIAGGGPVRSHEVTTPLAAVLDKAGAAILDKLVQARRWDLYSDAFEDAAHFGDYLEATGGGLMWAAARALGGSNEAAFRAIGRASALANLFLAAPELQGRGRKPFVDGRPEALRAMAEEARGALRAARRPKDGGAACLAAYRAEALLTRAIRDPRRVGRGTLGESEFRRRLSLILARARL